MMDKDDTNLRSLFMEEGGLTKLWVDAVFIHKLPHRLLSRFAKRFPQFKRLLPDLFGEAALMVGKELGRFDPERARVVNWDVFAGFYFRHAGRDLLRYAAGHGGDGGAVDVPRRSGETAAEALVWVDGLGVGDGEDRDPWDWVTEVTQESDNEAVAAERHDLEKVR